MRYIVTYFKELAQAIMEAGKPQICGKGWQAGDLVRADVVVCVESCQCGAWGRASDAADICR